MTTDQISMAFRELLTAAVQLSGPILLLCMAVGVVIAMLQAVTQIHEQAISFVLKLAAVALYLVLGGRWMMQTIREFALHLFDLMV